MGFYQKDKLLNVAIDRGYPKDTTLARALAPVMGITQRALLGRIRYGTLSKEECEVIASFLEMTMKEYYDVFMNGLFHENDEGHWVAHIEHPYLHLNERKDPRAKPDRKETKRTKKQELLAEIESL